MDPYIQSLQKSLKGLGYDPGEADGLNGPKTRAAAQAFAKGEVTAQILPNYEVDPDRRLNGIKSSLSGIVLAAAQKSSHPFVVNEGLRTRERQVQLVNSGASKTMNSKHLTGDAVDLWPIDPATKKKLPSDAAFPRGSAEARAADKALWDALRKISVAVKAEASKRGIKVVWGGDWKSFPDGPHFELG